MERVKLINSLDEAAVNKSKEKWSSVAKPLHSLGLLEDTVVKISGIFGDENFDIDKRCVVVMCADNGVVCEGVTQSDSSVTSIVAEAIGKGTSNINVVANTFRADVIGIDVGMKSDSRTINILDRKISHGTYNIARGSAMTTAQAEAAIKLGIDTVEACRNKGYKIIVTGEMGIGNTTTSSAIASVMLGLPPIQVTGRGAGLDGDGLKRKISAIERAIAINKPDKSKPIEMLAKLGGYDIAAMTGLFLGGAIYRVPIVIDGFISATAAALAVSIKPQARDYMLASHVSKEPAAHKLLEYIALKPLITAEMCLGEGTGGVMLLPLLDGALAVYNSAHRFEQLPMERYVDLC